MEGTATDMDRNVPAARLAALKKCTLFPGTAAKRFIRDTALGYPLSDRQVQYIALLAWKFRRQIRSSLAPEKKPDDLPPRPKVEKKVKTKLAPAETETLTLL